MNPGTSDNFRKLSMWIAGGGSDKLICFHKWSKIALAINPSVDISTSALVATVDSIHGSLTGQQQTDWDATEKADLVACIPDLVNAGNGIY